MPLFVWNNDLSVHVQEIDDQHRKLFGIINNLHEAIAAGQGRREVGQTLRELAEYTVHHFQVEEEYMRRFNYAGYYDHKIKHDAFAKKIAEFRKGYESNRFGLSNELMLFLRDWLSGHIRGTDMEYSEQFIRNGVK